MPEENVEVAREMLAAFEARDIDRMVALSDPHVEINALVSEIEGTYEGHEGVRRWIEGLISLAEDYWVVVEDLRPVGQDRFLILGRQGGTARAENLPFETPVAIIGQVRHGLLKRTQAYRTHQDALRAAGLKD